MSLPSAVPAPDATIVRRGTADDATMLADLAARTFSDTFASDNRAEDMAAYLPVHFAPGIQRAELGDAANTYLIAERAGEPVGYALVRAGPAPACVGSEPAVEVVRIYVDRPWFGRGVAPVLMDACTTEGRLRGARTLWLGVWERNPRAIAFYRKCGFRDVGGQTFQLGQDVQSDRVMARDIGDGRA